MKRISVILILFHFLACGTTNAQDAENRQIPDSVRILAIDEVTVLGRQNRAVVPAQILSGEKLQGSTHIPYLMRCAIFPVCR